MNLTIQPMTKMVRICIAAVYYRKGTGLDQDVGNRFHLIRKIGRDNLGYSFAASLFCIARKEINPDFIEA